MLKNNRLAVLIAGDLRMWARAAPYLFRFAEALSDNVDYYFATWNTTRDFWWPEEHSVRSTRPVTKQEITAPFNGRRLIDVSLVDREHCIPRQHLTIYYQAFLAKLANLAKNKYEFANGFIYDHVIEVRPDLHTPAEGILGEDSIRLPDDFEIIVGGEFTSETIPYMQMKDFYSRASSFGNDVLANRFHRKGYLYTDTAKFCHSVAPNNHWVLLDYVHSRKLVNRPFTHYETHNQSPIRPNYPKGDLDYIDGDEIRFWGIEWWRWQWYKTFDVIIDDDWAWVDIAVNQDREKDITLLTVGDSWIWGDEIGDSEGIQTAAMCSDTEYRTSRCVGNLLANKLDTNWVQVALPGASNDWIITEFEKMVTRLSPHTEKIIAVIGLTDHGRDWNNEIPPDYLPMVRDMLGKGVPLMEILAEVDRELYRRIDSILEKYPQVLCFAMPSFTNPQISHHTQLPITWNDLLLAGTPDKLPIHTSGIWELNRFLESAGLLSHQYKREIIEQLYPLVNTRVTHMKQNRFFFKRCHPTEDGHQIWAEYLFNHITRNHGGFLSTK